jgi:hypothetical protein
MSKHDDNTALLRAAWDFAYCSRKTEEADAKREAAFAAQCMKAEQAAVRRGWFDDEDNHPSPQELLWERLRVRWDAKANKLADKIDVLLKRTGHTVHEAVDPFLMMSMSKLRACKP